LTATNYPNVARFSVGARLGYTTLWRARQSRRNVEIAFKRLEKATDKEFEEFFPFFVENACNRRRDFL
jgi:hypothetical protein